MEILIIAIIVSVLTIALGAIAAEMEEHDKYD